MVWKLPKKAVDYYAIVKDVRSRLGIETVTIPLALIFLAIRSGGDGFLNDLREFGPVGDANALYAIEKKYGSLEDAIAAGLLPPK